MTPQKREDLAILLETARLAGARRAKLFADAPDAALVEILGINNPVVCRRIVATPRIARRLEQRLHTALAQQPVIVSPDVPAVAESAPVASPLASPVAHQPEIAFSDLSSAIAAAIQLSAAGALVGASDIANVSSRFGDAAVTFALTHRRIVPAWMQAVAGGREDVLRQLAATSILCWADGRAMYHLTEAAEADDPLDMDDAEARHGAAALAGAAVDFLTTGHADAHDVTGPET